jgi:Arylsulfatase A and related enzymes
MHSPFRNRRRLASQTYVIILTDDQGWGDLGVSGNTNLATPNIDTLARDGATVQHFYVCQVCAPTRAEFLTGRYYPRYWRQWSQPRRRSAERRRNDDRRPIQRRWLRHWRFRKMAQRHTTTAAPE